VALHDNAVRAARRLTAPLLAVSMFSIVAAQAAEVKHEASATSSAEVAVQADGTLVMQARNGRLVPYGLFDGEHYQPRLATVTTDVKQRTDTEGVDPSSTVTVTIDDLSGATPKRLAEFTDPGSEGEVLAGEYFDSRMPGCCAGPTVHSVRVLETGRLLYRTTGDRDAGSVAWANIPNARPAIVRWAAFDGTVGTEDLGRGVIGTISYGSKAETLSKVQLRVAGEGLNAVDLNLGLSHEATLVWVDAVSQEKGYSPDSGTPAYGVDIWSLDGVSAPERIAGVSVRLLNYDGSPLATIPIEADRLVPERAELATGVTLEAAKP
jgi:hypothetical protein